MRERSRKENDAPESTDMMRRIRLMLLVLAGGCVLSLVSCAIVGVLARPPLRLLLVPAATDIQVQTIGLGEQRITYRTSDANYAWYFMVVRNLARDGWELPLDRRGGLRDSPEIYWRILPLWLVYLKEEVALQGDPNVAYITIRREIIVPWRRYVP